MSVPRLSPDSSSVNVSNSVLRYFGVPQPHRSFAPLDKILDANGGKKICMFLFDGFGKYIQNAKKALCPFVWDHRRFDIETVYPPTTVAATTALLSGLYPIETGWLGWTQYFKRSGIYVNMFSGFIEGSQTPSAVKPAEVLRYVPITAMIDARKGRKASEGVMGFDCLGTHGEVSSGEFFNRVENAIRNPDIDFTYAYWPQPDHSLHEGGLHFRDTDKAIQTIDESLALICKRNPDVVFLFIADHGHVPVKWLDIRNYPDLLGSLYEPRFSIEPRFATFFVKPDSHRAFEDAFQAHFAKDFELYTKAQIYGENIFGYGQPHPLADEFIGDYTMLATGNKALFDGFNASDMVSTHAGATKKERIVELGIANA